VPEASDSLESSKISEGELELPDPYSPPPRPMLVYEEKLRL